MTPLKLHRDLKAELALARSHVETIRDRYGIAFDLAREALARIACCEDILESIAQMEEPANGTKNNN